MISHRLCTSRGLISQRFAPSTRCMRQIYQDGSRRHCLFASNLSLSTRAQTIRQAIIATSPNIIIRSPRHHFTTSSLLLHEPSSVKPTVSEAQRRSAQLELDRMTHSTSRLLGLDLNSSMCTTTTVSTSSTSSSTSSTGDQVGSFSDAIVNEARVALHYWSRRWYMHFHPGFGRAAKGSALSLDALRQWDKFNNACNDVEICGDDDTEEFPTMQHDGPGDAQPDVSMQNVGGDYGARQAERLLDWSLSNGLVPRGVFDLPRDSSHMEKEDKLRGRLGVSPNLACVNIIETYLLPTAYGGAGGGGGGGSNADTIILPDLGTHATLAKHFTINASYVHAVADATRVMKKMMRLQSEFPDYIASDSLSVKAELNVWSKRAILLGKNQRSKGCDTNTVDGGDKNDTGSIDFDPILLLKSLEQESDTSINGGEMVGDETYTFQFCLDRMESILADAESRYILTRDEHIRPSCDWYNHVLSIWARSTDLDRAVVRTKQILQGMEAYHNILTGNEYDANDKSRSASHQRQYLASPDIVSYNSVLFCLTRDTGKSRAKEAETLLQHVKGRYRETRNPDIRPDEITYGLVLHALAQAGMAHEAESLLDQLEDDKRDDAIVPTLTIYNTVLNAWANSHLPNAPKRAEALLDRMKSHADIGKNPGVEPDSISISTVISCHARSKTRHGAERGEQLLNEAAAMYLQGNARVKPDAIMFNCAISGWTNISGSESEHDGSSTDQIPAIRAELLLHKMKGPQLNIKPVVQTFNHILDCWSKSEIKGCADRALKMLRAMPEYGVRTDEVSYNSVLHAMTKESDPKWLVVAEDMLHEMKEKKIPIGQITYHVLMNIYGKIIDKNGARKAEMLLRGMEEEGLVATDISYNICIDAYARRGDCQKAESLLEEMISLSNRGRLDCRPSIHSFASVVNALAKSRNADAVARAEEIVRKVEQLDYVSPNSILYNSLIDCVVKSRLRANASQAEEILRRMENLHRAGNTDVKPNAYAYSMVLTCCARSEEPGSAERAERILLNMESLYAEGLSDAAANSRCYSAVITAWARSNDPNAVDRAFALIDRIEQNGKHTSPHGKPNTHCYNACIHAIAKSQHPRKAEKCEEVLQRMSAAVADGFHDATPSSITYSTIINACAYTRGNDEEKKDAFNLARTCFKTLLSSKDMEPCVSCFANFFRVISRHLKHGAIRDQLAEAVFLEGCARGKMDDQALNDFRKASPKVSDRILSKYRVLPDEWHKTIRNDGYKFQ